MEQKYPTRDEIRLMWEQNDDEDMCKMYDLMVSMHDEIDRLTARDAWLRNEYAKITNRTCFDEKETYTTGYRNGHDNGRVELIRFLLGIPDGSVRETGGE